MITETKNSIVFENSYAEIAISKKDASLEKITVKKNSQNIKGEDTLFFGLFNEENVPFKTNSAALNGNVVTLDTELGQVDIEVNAEERYFTFELKTAIPKEAYYLALGNALYEYDTKDDNGPGAAGLAITYWTNPTIGPSIFEKKTVGKVFPHLRDIGAKYALIISDIKDQRDILKEASLTIDKNTGLVSRAGGAWARDNRIAYSNYIIQYQSGPEFFKERLPFYKAIGIDQIDYHHNSHETMGTFRQGDFRFCGYKDGAEFKEKVTDVLEENGMSAILHTYAHYVDHEAEGFLSETKYLKDFVITESYTLKEPLTKDSEYIVVEEDISGIKTDDSFYTENCPYFIMGEELIRFEKTDKGLKIVKRAASGTKFLDHQAGEKLDRPYRLYWCFYTKKRSPAFYEVARRTAKAYNDGGFKMIYFDAIDSLFSRCGGDARDGWFYEADFICEVLKYCKIDPLVEDSAGPSSIWALGGRRGAFDSPNRHYKAFTDFHESCVVNAKKMHSTATMGWYAFYPSKDTEPGNYLAKYQHFDDIDHVATIALRHDFSMVPNGPKDFEELYRYKGLKKNIDRYLEYDKLRKEMYFSEEYREKLMSDDTEYALIKKRGNKYSFVQKKYQTEILHDLSDEKRGYGEFKNPFGAQTPFIRIEARLSTKGENPLILFPLDENKPLSEQKTVLEFPTDISIKNGYALKVRVTGNGKKGSAVCIKMRHSNDVHGLAEYFIDTDFKGTRDFILFETDNGRPTEHPFDKNEHYWAKWGGGFNHEHVKKIELHLTEEAEGVRMSSIVACEQLYDVLKNPTVKIGESEIMFECELMSSDYIEFDGKRAVVIDRYGNEKEIWYNGSIRAPRGRFKATLNAKSLNRMTPRAELTFGFTGKEIK